MTNHRWNNFYGWFPNGFYRRLPNLDARAQQLIADLDKVIAEQNFDLPLFQELEDKGLAYFHEYKEVFMQAYKKEKRELTPGEEQRTAELGRLEAENNKQLDAMLEPVIMGMMELGYSQLELIK